MPTQEACEQPPYLHTLGTVLYCTVPSAEYLTLVPAVAVPEQRLRGTALGVLPVLAEPHRASSL